MDKTHRVRAALVVVLLGVSAVVIWAVIVLPDVRFPVISQERLAAQEMTDKERFDVELAQRQVQNAFRTSVVQTLGGLAVVSGAFLAWLQFEASRKDNQAQRDEKRRDYHLESYNKALESLGGVSTDVRLGGVHGFAELTELSRVHRAPCADVLSAYIRTRSPWPPEPPRPAEQDVIRLNGPSLRQWSPDVQAALSVLGRHTYLWHEIEYVRLRGSDLRRANLTFGHFENAAFTESHLDGAYMMGVNLNGASLRDASLRGANLRDAVMDYTNIRGADFSGADLEGASFRDAVFDSSTAWPSLDARKEAIKRGAREVDVQESWTSAEARGVRAE